MSKKTMWPYDGKPLRTGLPSVFGQEPVVKRVKNKVVMKRKYEVRDGQIWTTYWKSKGALLSRQLGPGELVSILNNYEKESRKFKTSTPMESL